MKLKNILKNKNERQRPPYIVSPSPVGTIASLLAFDSALSIFFYIGCFEYFDYWVTFLFILFFLVVYLSYLFDFAVPSWCEPEAYASVIFLTALFTILVAEFSDGNYLSTIKWLNWSCFGLCIFLFICRELLNWFSRVKFDSKISDDSEGIAADSGIYSRCRALILEIFLIILRITTFLTSKILFILGILTVSVTVIFLMNPWDPPPGIGIGNLLSFLSNLRRLLPPLLPQWLLEYFNLLDQSLRPCFIYAENFCDGGAGSHHFVLPENSSTSSQSLNQENTIFQAKGWKKAVLESAFIIISFFGRVIINC